jgi:outer membrane beta-barrel protein
MEARLRSFLLISLISGIIFASPALRAAEPSEPDNAEAELKPVIQPEIKRQEFDEARIDTEDFEVGPFIGLMSIEDFGTNAVYGARLAYHITEELFIEGTIGQTNAGETSFEAIIGGAPLLTDEERTLTYYNVNIGFNLLPGEAFLTQNVTYNNALFVIAGVGSTEFAGADRFTLNFGLGYRLLMTDYMALRFDFRDHIFDMDLWEEKITHNLEFSTSLTFLF